MPYGSVSTPNGDRSETGIQLVATSLPYQIERDQVFEWLMHAARPERCEPPSHQRGTPIVEIPQSGSQCCAIAVFEYGNGRWCVTAVQAGGNSGQDVQEPMLLRAVGRGVPDGAMQAGRALERDAQIETGKDELGNLGRARGTHQR